jgi:hypothetical protein
MGGNAIHNFSGDGSNLAKTDTVRKNLLQSHAHAHAY